MPIFESTSTASVELALTFYQVAPLTVQALVSASAAAAVAKSAAVTAVADPYPPINFSPMYPTLVPEGGIGRFLR